MEDFGDRAGYAPGRTRSEQFGLCYLRLDRDLLPGMVVTIEPGIYFVPAILRSERLLAPLRGDFRSDKLAQFADVRGIRIEEMCIRDRTQPSRCAVLLVQRLLPLELRWLAAARQVAGLEERQQGQNRHDPLAGRSAVRGCVSHGLWSISPFNFSI